MTMQSQSMIHELHPLRAQETFRRIHERKICFSQNGLILVRCNEMIELSVI